MVARISTDTNIEIQGASKKIIHSDFSLKSIPVVGFYLFRGVLEPEFRA